MNRALIYLCKNKKTKNYAIVRFAESVYGGSIAVGKILHFEAQEFEIRGLEIVMDLLFSYRSEEEEEPWEFSGNSPESRRAAADFSKANHSLHIELVDRLILGISAWNTVLGGPRANILGPPVEVFIPITDAEFRSIIGDQYALYKR